MRLFEKTKKFFVAALLTAVAVPTFLTGCGSNKEKVLVYTSSEDYVVEYLNQRLKEEFPDIDVTVEYMSTGNLAAKLKAEGTSTDCDIIAELEYGYLAQLDNAGILADLSSYDRSKYVEDTKASDNYMPEIRVGGGVIVNTELLKEKGLAEPKSYEDLLKPEYKGLISMPNPKSSGTGYMFLKSLVNAMGEEAAFEYFDKLTPNILQYTSSGSGPVNSLVQKEAAIGLGMTSNAVVKINEGAPLKILFFDEGSPYTLYGQSVIKGKETNESVKKVYDFLVNKFIYETNEKFFPEKVFTDIDNKLDNYPSDIKYADMSSNTIEEKERLLDKWKY